jgi:DNA invertase Pin-like site-specific DNA recombinase
MKQVYCLYRVSTVQQLREDDIPMQRQACREFAATHQWGIIKELYEKGISGFKTPIQDRKVLQQIKKDAELRKFDILLVFMFDRLGRRDSETPFFVEDLSMYGVEIWSVTEGQQQFESHADKLINYIRYWQAESLKTSDRIKTRMGQLTVEGFFCGGRCAYGYQLIKTWRKNDRGHEIHDLAIQPDEAAVIQKIFDYRIHYGYGSRKLQQS